MSQEDILSATQSDALMVDGLTVRTSPSFEQRVLGQIDSKDTMYAGDREHYFRVGSSALRCIQSAAHIAHRESFDSILDFPCGHGRVSRFLRAAFPSARLTVADIDQDAVDFCARTFGGTPIYSSNDTKQIQVDGSYDLIWCGSLLTHFDMTGCLEFLDFFRSILSLNGILVFTMHGRLSASWLRSRQCIYGLESENIPQLLKSYDTTGFGYSDYPGVQGYGISLTSPAWVLSQIRPLA
jgi:SAM-dependent methyltransferase